MHSSHFPNIDDALLEPNGLLAQGGKLSADMLLDAYHHGIFPWPSGESDDLEMQLLWWSPDPRAVIFTDAVVCSKSLRKQIKRCGYRLTMNQAFDRVVDACATVDRHGSQGTWITNEIQRAYRELHSLGHAHSVEVWDNNELIGGLYGVVVGELFCGESMFHIKANASKMALLALAKYLRQLNWPLIDCQIENSHLSSLGAVLITREEFKRFLPTQEASLEKLIDKAPTAFGEHSWRFNTVLDLIETSAASQ